MIATLMLILASWFVLSAVATYVWVTWRMRCNDRRIVQRFDDWWIAQQTPDWDAELRHLIEDHRA